MSFINMLFKGTNVNKHLERAIDERKCDEVKVLLSAGADINHTVNSTLDTMLHLSRTAGIARDLLGYSANVNAINVYKKTPLHSATLRGNTEVVKTLLEHGAELEAKDCNGNTALSIAVKKREPCPDIIKVLILRGANINTRSHEGKGIANDCSPLDDAVMQEDLTAIKAVIKYTLIKTSWKSSPHFELHHYHRCKNFPAIQRYKKDCQTEIFRMSKEILSDEMTLEQLAMSKVVFRESLVKEKEEMRKLIEKSFAIATSDHYAIYRDILQEKLVGPLDKVGLLNKLRTIQIYMYADSSNQAKKIILDSDAAHNLGKCLSRKDLFHLILAFYDPRKDALEPLCSINNFVELRREMNKRLCEPSTSSSYVKHFKVCC